MVDLHISKRLKAALPPHTEHERKQLEANIVADGEVLDPILFWNDGKRLVVVDGMHRWEIIRRLKIGQYMLKEITTIGPSYEDAEQWVFDHYDGQRHQTREAVGKWFNEMKAARGGARESKPSNDGLKTTAEKIAKKTGVSPRTVERAGARVETLSKCSQAVQKGVESGQVKLSDADVRTLSKLNQIHQDNIASDLRKGHAKTVQQAMEKRKIKPNPLSKCSADFAAWVIRTGAKISQEQTKTLSSLPPKKRNQVEQEIMGGKSAGHAINPHRPKVKTLTPEEKELIAARDQIKMMADTVGRFLSKAPTIDDYRNKWPSKQGDHVVKQATQFYESLRKWQRVIK